MSTLAAARADNFYYPPNFDPKKGGLNKQQGQHPLRERAKKLDEGILVIRFEMPFNVWCNGCQHLIGKGVRFNAEKKQIGNYHSTKIWSFSMRSPCCQTRIEVQTDPKNCEYQIVAGARRKAEAYTAKDAGVMELDDPEEAAAAARDPFRKLERGDADKRKAREAAQQLSMLVADSQVKHRDDYAINKEMRRRNRGMRKEETARDEHRQRLNLPDSVTLAPQTEQDRQAASLVVFGNPARFDERWRERRRAIHQAPIFAPSAPVARHRGPTAAAPSASLNTSGAAATSTLPPKSPKSDPAAPQSSAAAHGSDAHASAEPCIHQAQISGSASGDDLAHGHHEHGQHSAGCSKPDSSAAQAGRPNSGQSSAPSAKQSAWAANLGAKGSKLGLKAAAGVRKPISALRHAGSKLGSKHGRAQAGKLSRIRLGAKLVLGNVPV